VSKKVQATPVRDQLFQNVLKSLHDNIVSTFQRQLSRYIRIVNLPKVTPDSSEHRIGEEDMSVLEEREPLPAHEDNVILRIFDENSKLQTKDEEMERLLREMESDDEEEDAFFMEFGSHDMSKLKSNPLKIPSHVLQYAYDAFIPEFNIDDDDSQGGDDKEDSPLKSKDSSPNNSPIMAQQAMNMLSKTSPARRKSVIVYGTKGIHSLSKQERDAREKKMNGRAMAPAGMEIGGVGLPISPRSSTVSPRDRTYNAPSELVIPMETTETDDVALVITSYGSAKEKKRIIDISGDCGSTNAVQHTKNPESLAETSRVLNDLSVANAEESKASKGVDIDENELMDTFV